MPVVELLVQVWHAKPSQHGCELTRAPLQVELFAPAAIDWSVDHPEIVQYWDGVRNTSYSTTSGTTFAIHGIAFGTAVLHGAYGRTAVSVPVTVR